jgi:hypothetical protein
LGVLLAKHFINVLIAWKPLITLSVFDRLLFLRFSTASVFTKREILNAEKLMKKDL